MSYADAARDYLAAGWAPLPLPAGAKAPPPDGWTGRDAPWPSAADVETWCAERAEWNLGVRAPRGVLGLDVDAYDGKSGAATVAQAQADLGPLPATWTSSRRFDTDPVSGIRWYRVPEDSRWRPVLGPHVEVVQHGHRYGVAWPSLVEGRRYRWRDPNGELVEAVVPKAEELPALPDSWQERLQRVDAEPVRGAQDARDVFRAFRPGPACRPVTAAVEALSTALDGTASRHDAAVAGVHALACYGREGHRGVPEALRAARTAFLTALGPDRGQAEATAEWSRLAAGALQLAAGRVPVQAQRCSCEAVSLDVALPAAEAPEPVALLQRYPRTDLVALLGHERPEREWVVERFLPAGAATSVYAPAGAGKSLLSLWLAVCISTGNPFLGLPTVRRRVLYVDLENTLVDLAERLDSLGFDETSAVELDQLVHLALPPLPALDTAGGGNELLALLEAHELQARDVVVLDSTQRMVGEPEDRSDTWRAYYRHTGVELKRRGLTVVRLDNTGKDEDRGARGSSSKRDDVDVEWYLHRTNDAGGFALEPKKGRMVSKLGRVHGQLVRHRNGRVEYVSPVNLDDAALPGIIAWLDEYDVPADASDKVAWQAVCTVPNRPARGLVRRAQQRRREAS
jgi:hypothetical protein